MTKEKKKNSEAKQKLRYTTILHEARMRLGLTMEEYAVCDLIHHLQSNPKNTTLWCYASKEYIAETLGISRATVFRILNRLIDEKLIERHMETKQLRTTAKWFETAIEYKPKTDIQSQNETDSLNLILTQPHTETPDHLNTRLYNNRDNNKNNSFPSPLPSSRKKERKRDKHINLKEKGNKELFEKLRSGIYREDLFLIYDNLVNIKTTEELAEDLAYKAIKSVLMNNETFLRDKFNVTYNRFPFQATATTIKKKFSYKRLPHGSDPDLHRNFFVAAICNTVAETLVDMLQSKEKTSPH
jgi:Mn-dependent DtxR family transcriptional regulator